MDLNELCLMVSQLQNKLQGCVFYLFQSQNTISQEKHFHMISASIKMTNPHYFQALQQLALSNLPQLHTKPKLLQLPFYNFVCTFVEILTQFSKSNSSYQHSQIDIFNLNSYLVDYYFRKHDGNSFEIYRQFFSFVRSWKKYTQHHEEAKLFLSLLTPQRNTVEGVKLFLKFRKCILKSLNQKILQQLSLTHQDTLTITHTLFSHNPEAKNYVTKKINQLFISLKRKLINSAKVNGAVMCEFFMACSERFSQMNVNTLFDQKPEKKKIIRENYINKKDQINRTSPFKDKQLNYLENPESLNKCIDMKYNLSFSEQFASYYSPPQIDRIPQIKENDIQQKCTESNFVSNFEELENQWKMKASEEAPINLVRNSLTFFKKKDQQIDEKLTHCKTFHLNLHNQLERLNLDDSKQNVSYPEGWENFIKTNAKTKKKLMSQKKLNNFEENY